VKKQLVLKMPGVLAASSGTGVQVHTLDTVLEIFIILVGMHDDALFDAELGDQMGRGLADESGGVPGMAILG